MKWLILLLLIPFFAFGQSYQSRSPAPYPDRINLGEYAGVDVVNKFAFRSVLDVTDGEALISSDNTTNDFTVLTTATTFNISYNNATDGTGSTGALILAFDYIDENLFRQQAVHVLGSTGSDITSFSGLGINSVVVVSSGSSQFNVNDIAITATSNGSMQQFIAAEDSVSGIMVIHTPINAKVVIKFFALGGFKDSGSTNVKIKLITQLFSRAANTYYSPGETFIDTNLTNYYLQADPGGAVIPEGSVYILKASTTSNNSTIGAGVTHIFYENP